MTMCKLRDRLNYSDQVSGKWHSPGSPKNHDEEMERKGNAVDMRNNTCIGHREGVSRFLRNVVGKCPVPEAWTWFLELQSHERGAR